MVKQEEKIKYNNMKNKYERTQAKNDMLEQENIELKKQLEAQSRIIANLETANQKAQQQANEQYNKLFDEISKINEEVLTLNAKKKKIARPLKSRIFEGYNC